MLLLYCVGSQWSYVAFAASIALVALTFVETPLWVWHVDTSRLHFYPTSGIPFLSPVATYAIEGVLLSVVLADVGLMLGYTRKGDFKRHIRDAWTLALVYILLVDYVVALITPYRWWRLGPYLRVGLIVLGHVPTYNAFKIIARLAKAMAPVLGLFFLLLIFLSWFAILFFPPTSVEGRQRFSSFGEAVWQLLLGLTASNYPEGMAPAFRANSSSSVFFAVVAMVGVYFFSNMLLGLVVYSFKEEKVATSEAMRNRFNRNVDLAFMQLDPRSTGSVEAKDIRTLVAQLNRYYSRHPYLSDDEMALFMAAIDSDESTVISREDFHQVRACVAHPARHTQKLATHLTSFCHLVRLADRGEDPVQV